MTTPDRPCQEYPLPLQPTLFCTRFLHATVLSTSQEKKGFVPHVQNDGAGHHEGKKPRHITNDACWKCRPRPFQATVFTLATKMMMDEACLALALGFNSFSGGPDFHLTSSLSCSFMSLAIEASPSPRLETRASFALVRLA